MALDWAQLITLVTILIFALVCLKAEKSKPSYRYVALLGLLWSVGITAALRSQGSMPKEIWGPFSALTGILLAAGIVCIGTYKSFSLNFARVVYNDFLVLEKKPAEEEKK